MPILSPVPKTRPDGALAAARHAVLFSAVDPARGWQRARDVLAEAERAGDLEARVVARRALALAARELGDLPLAGEELRRAVAEGTTAPPQRAAQARMSLVTVLTELGSPAEALRVADAAEPYLCRVERAKLDSQRAVALCRLGRLREALARFDHAVRVLTPLVAGGGADELSVLDHVRFLAGALLNRGIAAAYLGDHDRAEADLRHCLALAEGGGLGHLTALARANLPFVAARRGDISGAFARYRAAEKALAAYPERLATMRCDLADALVAAHLPGEARALLDMAVPELESAGALGALAEARLLLAQLELRTGAAHQAAVTAGRARAELAAQGRAGFLPLADDVMLRAGLAASRPDAPRLSAMVACAGELSVVPWPGAADDLRLCAAEVAIELGRARTAERLLRRLSRAASGATTRQHAVAMARALRGDHEGALRAAARGLAHVGASAALVGEPVTRAHAVKAGERLAAFGLSVAIGTGRGRTALTWAERWRAVARTGRPDSPDLAELRAALGETALGEGVLVEYLGHGDRLAAVVMTGDEIALHPLGDGRAAVEAAIRLRYALRRAALRDGPESISDDEPVLAEAAAVDAELLHPLAGHLPPGPLIVVPPGPLHALPWPVLPSLADRPVCVAESAAAWLAHDRAAASAAPSGVVAVAGPGLAHARVEADAVVARHSGARRVPARAPEVLAALDGAAVAHLAAHGTFHAHSPLMSSLLLDDGPLMAYDLLGLGRPPTLAVLSACDGGMARTPTDGRPLGLAGALLERGTACVIAGTTPVRDDQALALMAALHDLLAAGRPPAAALTAASAATGVRGFVCLGAGHRPLPRGDGGSAGGDGAVG
ncbi:CHAT domain-containing protein [Spongiactinospora sp. TRM90649]|uniref:CHAT domain-containing protein n=1 Tax=Spongiactinospora sp. TRM90649 TaxID=3031114 RepID=UPI0023FA2A36|nr:CHAT domain-containing protein [Spongiactinospora sp. TRM90649]MDF5755404.1 CHAT domain-containing protein [Spongiactinospora sp. TRM90649]